MSWTPKIFNVQFLIHKYIRSMFSVSLAILAPFFLSSSAVFSLQLQEDSMLSFVLNL